MLTTSGVEKATHVRYGSQLAGPSRQPDMSQRMHMTIQNQQLNHSSLGHHKNYGTAQVKDNLN